MSYATQVGPTDQTSQSVSSVGLVRCDVVQQSLGVPYDNRTLPHYNHISGTASVVSLTGAALDQGEIKMS
jgi:hypothetical protein